MASEHSSVFFKRLAAKLEARCPQSSYKGMVYVKTNEVGAPETIAILTDAEKQSTHSNTSAHIGVSSYFNLDIIAARETAFGVVCDINSENKLWLDKTFELVAQCETRHAFVHEMCLFLHSFSKQNPWIFFSPHMESGQETITRLSKQLGAHALLLSYKHLFRVEGSALTKLLAPITGESDPMELTPSELLEGELKRTTSWLSNDVLYRHIRERVCHNRIVALTVDMADTITVVSIRNLLRDNGFALDTLYLSNIEEWSDSTLEVRRCVAETLRQLEVQITSSDTIIIRASQESLRQRVSQRKK